MNENLQPYVEMLVPDGEIQYVNVTCEPKVFAQRDALGNIKATETDGYVVTITINVKESTEWAD